MDGIICFVNYFKTDSQMRMMSFGLVEGILAMSIITFILGIIIIFNPFTSATVATVTVGVFLAITEIINIMGSIITMIKIKKQ